MTTETNLRLYDYAASGNCYKVRLLLAQLGRPYDRIPVDIFAGETLTDEYGRINPFRSTPVLEIAPAATCSSRTRSSSTSPTGHPCCRQSRSSRPTSSAG